MTGYCILCKMQIFKFSGKALDRPMGNYRSIKCEFEDGGLVTIPVCMDCHDAMTDDHIPEIQEKVMKHIRESIPEGFSSSAVEYSALAILKRKIVKIYQKEGCLKQEDIEKGEIWQ